jgi:hypothetical protein
MQHFTCCKIRSYSIIRAAMQHILAAQHAHSSCTGVCFRDISIGMIIETPMFETDLADLVRVAFDKSWGFVSTDPALADNDMDEMRARLSRHIARLAQGGERNVWRLANGAIGQLRREQRAA